MTCRHATTNGETVHCKVAGFCAHLAVVNSEADALQQCVYRSSERADLSSRTNTPTPPLPPVNRQPS